MTKLARLTVSARSIGRRREEAGDDRLDCPLPLPCGGIPAILVVLIFSVGELPGRSPRATTQITRAFLLSIHYIFALAHPSCHNNNHQCFCPFPTLFQAALLSLTFYLCLFKAKNEHTERESELRPQMGNQLSG